MKSIITLRRLTLAASLGACALFTLPAGAADTLRTILDVEKDANQYAQQTQVKIDDISEETQKLLSEYRQILRQVESLEIYNAQLQGMIDGQEEEIASLEKDISRVTEINRQITPLMLRMLDTLEQFVAMDVPFLKEERDERLGRLNQMMERSDVSTAEKFRRVLEAYQIENDYGRTVEAYRGSLNRDGQTLTVDFLQIGRIVFAYVTLDGEEAGIWNEESRQWETLPGRYISNVEEGIRMARDQVTPDLLVLPVSAPEKVQ